MFQLTFLGTSAGVPTKKRNVSGLAVECLNPYLSSEKQASNKNRPWVLIDCGEGTQHQLLHTKLSINKLEAICITHVHGDHCYGLVGLLASMAMSGRTQSLTIIAPQPIAQLIDVVMVTTDLHLPYAIEFIAIEDQMSQDNHLTLEFSPSHTLTIEMVALSHRVASYGFILSQDIRRLTLNTAKLNADNIAPSNVWGTLQKGHDVQIEQGQLLRSSDYTYQQCQHITIVIGGDNDTPELLADAVNNASLLVHEATYTQEVADSIKAREDAFDPKHSSVQQVAQFAQTHQLPNVILTHISSRYQSFDDPTAKHANVANLRVEAQQNFQGHCWIAQDFDRFVVDTEHCVTKL